MSDTGVTTSARDRVAHDPVLALRAAVERMQIARCGSVALDRLVADALERAFEADTENACRFGRLTPGQHWSINLEDAITLLPRDYNFSLGHRDGVCWAWVQPNDQWEPAECDSRHDHPGGSGLVVGYTTALALTCAALILRARQIEGARQCSRDVSLHRLVYWSRSALFHTTSDLEAEMRAILAVSRRNNARDNVTGALLLYNDGCFAQVLEGPPTVVRQRFERIRTDARHHDVTLLQAGPAPRRLFADWSMGFVGHRVARTEFDTLSAGADDVIRLLHDLVNGDEQWELTARRAGAPRDRTVS